MRVQYTMTLAIILAAVFALADPISSRGREAPDPRVSVSREANRDGSQNKDSPQFVMIFGDSYSRMGSKHNKTSRKPRPGPRAENPIGNPKWPGKTSTGGMNWIGYMVSEFNQTLSLAYGFAGSGSVVDPELVSPNPTYAPCFEDQIRSFNESIGHRPDYAAWNADNAVAVIWIGINDIRLSYTEKGIKKFMEAVVKRLFEYTHELHNLGLRQFVLMEAPPLNFLPRYQRLRWKNTVKLTYAVRVWNDLLIQHLELFRQAHPDSRATVVEISDIYTNVFFDPGYIGSPNSRCIDGKGERCLWSDKFHPGKKIHRLMAERVAEAAWGGQ